MLAQQYTSSWNRYALWTGVGSAFLAFGIFPLYSLIGIYQLHHWNYFYQLLLLFTNAIMARGLLLLVISIEQSQPASSRVSSVFSGLQLAATKPLDKDKEDTTDNED